jgi:hypothetical protein
VVVALCSLPAHIKRGRLYQSLCENEEENECNGQNSIKKGNGVCDNCNCDGDATPGICTSGMLDAARDDGFRKASSARCCTDASLSFPVAYCRFELPRTLVGPAETVVAVAAPAARKRKLATAEQEDLTAIVGAGAGAGVVETACACVYACEMIATLRYWGVDEIPGSLLWYLLESSELSPPAAAQAAPAPAPAPAPAVSSIERLQEAHREGDMFAFVQDLQQLRGMSELQRLEYAAHKGYLQLLRAVHENVLHGFGCPVHEIDAEAEAESAFETAKAVEVQRKDGPVSSGTGEKSALACSRVCSIAAKGGHLDCLQYAHEHGCPWDPATCFNAAK